MAFTSTILESNAKSIYTSDGSNAITTMYFCNPSDVTVQFNIYAVPNGEYPDGNKIIYCEVPLTAKDTYIIDTEKLVLESGDSLFANILDPTSQLITGLIDSGWGENKIVKTVTWASDRSEYLIAGEDGKVAISQEGENWEYRDGVIALGWPSGVSILDSTRMPLQKYVVVGEGGWMAASTDGINWTSQSALSGTSWGTADINAVTHNGSIFIAVGPEARVATSVNGTNWTVHQTLSGTSWSTGDIYCVIWSGTDFIIGGDGGRIATSPDGIVWNFNSSLQQVVEWGPATRLTTIVYSGTPSIGYVALSLDNNKCATSFNLNTWTYNESLSLVGNNAVPGISGATYKPGFGFYAIGNGSDIFLLDSGQNWNKIDSLNYPPWGGVAGTEILWNSSLGHFIAVGYGSRVATSPDGIIWTYQSDPPDVITDLPNVIVTVSSIGI